MTSKIDGLHQIALTTADLEQESGVVFRDDQGQFGQAGEEEWMAFFRDPDGHMLAFASRTNP